MADQLEDDVKTANDINIPLLRGLANTSDHTSENSSIVSAVSVIKISKENRLRFDGMICDSEYESGENCQEPSKSPSPSTIQGNNKKQELTDLNTHNNIETGEKPQVLEVKLLSEVKRSSNFLDCEPHSNPDSCVDVSGLTSFLNVTGLTENIPLHISGVSDILRDIELQDNNQITPMENHLEDKDFSPSDESDFDPESAYISDGDDDYITEDEYYGDQLVKKNKRRNKRNCDNIQKIQEKNTLSPNKAQYEEDKVIPNEIQIEVREERHNVKKIGKRNWDRRNACFYCQQLVTNYSRHLLRKHPNEMEVINYKSVKDEDPKIRKIKRTQITDKLRNKGNFLHNSNVCFNRDGENTILPAKRNTRESSSPSSFATCKTCLGTFKRSSFFRHFKKCGANSNANQLPSCKRRVLYHNSITIIPNTESASVELQDKILPHLRSDEISLVVKNDSLILAYGSRLLKKKKERRSRKSICSKMRDLASLLIILRKKNENIETLTDVLDPEKYEIFIDGIKTMCGFDEETGFVKVTSIPARMRPAVLGCIEILYTQSIMSTESTAYKEAYKKKLDDFKRLIEINWQWEISSNAEKTKKRTNMTKEKIIPLEEDISTVMKKIHKLEIKYAKKLRKNRDVLNYEFLCVVTIAHIIMLDRKRAGDVAEAELSFYVNRKNEEIPEKVLETLTPQQRKCIDELDVFQIPGKRTRSVPILLTKTMRENIDLIIACREDLNIPNSNRYLFARPYTVEPFDGGKCLDKIKKYCNLKRPEMLTSTGMRHHIATMSQIHAKQNDQYTEHLAGFLGHDLSVHAQNYRLPLQVLQKAVVGTQLIEYENVIETQTNQNKTETITSQFQSENFTQDQEHDPKNLLSGNKQALDEIEYPYRSKDSATYSGAATANNDRKHASRLPENINEEPEESHDNPENNESCINSKLGKKILNDNWFIVQPNNESERTKNNEDTECYTKIPENNNIRQIQANKKTNEDNIKNDRLYQPKTIKTTKFVKRNKVQTPIQFPSDSNNDDSIEESGDYNEENLTELTVQTKTRRATQVQPSIKEPKKKKSRLTLGNKSEEIIKNKATKTNKVQPSETSSTSESEKDNRRKRKKLRVSKANESDDDIKAKSKIRKPKKHPARDLASSSESEEEEKPRRHKTTHKKWTDEEVKAVKKHLQTFIKRKINPGKAKCMEVLKKEPVLNNRTWMQLNSYVNNIYKKK